MNQERLTNVSTFWTKFDLATWTEIITKTSEVVTINQDRSLSSRKDLALSTKTFRQRPVEDQLTELGKFVKKYQVEVDQNTIELEECARKCRNEKEGCEYVSYQYSAKRCWLSSATDRSCSNTASISYSNKYHLYYIHSDTISHTIEQWRRRCPTSERVNLGEYRSAKGCAIACESRRGCSRFTFGSSSNSISQCFSESCDVSSLVNDNTFNLYSLTEVVVVDAGATTSDEGIRNTGGWRTMDIETHPSGRIKVFLSGKIVTEAMTHSMLLKGKKNPSSLIGSGHRLRIGSVTSTYTMAEVDTSKAFAPETSEESGGATDSNHLRCSDRSIMWGGEGGESGRGSGRDGSSRHLMYVRSTNVLKSSGSGAPRSCSDALMQENSPKDGTRVLDLLGDGRTIPVYCDMTSNGGGWTQVYSSSDIVRQSTSMTSESTTHASAGIKTAEGNVGGKIMEVERMKVLNYDEVLLVARSPSVNQWIPLLTGVTLDSGNNH